MLTSPHFTPLAELEEAITAGIQDAAKFGIFKVYEARAQPGVNIHVVDEDTFANTQMIIAGLIDGAEGRAMMRKLMENIEALYAIKAAKHN